MGTNYYLHEKPPCPHCGRPYPDKHIGKSSGGWCFALHVIPEEGINDLQDWYDRWMKSDAQIFDEYGKELSPTQMFEIVTKRQGREGCWSKQGLVQNDAVPGPNGLARSKLGRSCVKHGAGTWDCIEGEFS